MSRKYGETSVRAHVSQRNKMIGRRIKIRRELLGMTQKDVSKMIGVTFQQLQKYENGECSTTADKLWKISKCLHTNVSYFFLDINYAELKEFPVEYMKTAGISDELYRMETQLLIRNYYRINNRQVAKHMLEIIKEISNLKENNAVEEYMELIKYL